MQDGAYLLRRTPLCAVAEMLTTAPYSRWAGSRHRSSIGPLVAASNTDEVTGDDVVAGKVATSTTS